MRIVFSALVALALLWSAPARADGIVLESYVGRRPNNAAPTLQDLTAALLQRGYVPGASLSAQFEAQGSRPSLSPAGLPSDFVQQAEKGQQAWTQGNFSDALAILTPLENAARQNPGAFTQNQSAARNALFKALLGIAISQLKSGAPGDAEATFAEMVRSFPDMNVSAATYGPDIAKSYANVKASLGKQKAGTLIVNLVGESGAVYLNEKFENMGSVNRALIPGEYRIFAQVAKGLSRVHRVRIEPGQTVTLTIDTGFDRAVQASSQWLGFAFDDAQERAEFEAVYATKLARMLGMDSVIVVTIDLAQKPLLIGAIIDLGKRSDLRRASYALDPAPTQRTAVGLAKYLTSGEEQEGIQVQGVSTARAGMDGPGSVGGGGGSTLPGGPLRDTPRTGMWGGWKWVATAAAVGGLGAGGVLLSLDGSCATTPPPGQQCRDLRDFKIGGWASIGGGAVMTGVAIVLFVKSGGDAEPARTGYVVPTRGGAMAGYSVRF